MSIAIRPIVEEEFAAFAAADASAFGFEHNEQTLEQVRPLIELDRSLAAFDGGEIAGTTAIFSFDMTVPGERIPVAGVTWVGVRPTHRRRGILTELMRRQLRDVRDKGEAIAALWASESVIYGRFGYGLAAQGIDFELEREHAKLSDRAPAGCGRLRIIDKDEALRSWPSVYERVLPQYPGMYTRNETWWQHHVLREMNPAQAAGTRFFVQYEEDGEALGYARYRVQGNSTDGLPDGTLSVQELFALNERAHTSLWQYLFGVDLIGLVRARLRPLDEPLLWLLADPRRLLRRPYDSLWVRIVDVPAALEARRYSAEGRLVFEVRDDFCPWVAGRFELEGTTEGASCRVTDAEPDIELAAADLGAAYLGGVRFGTLARAGRVRGEASALRTADAMFAWDPPPWCPEVF